MKFIKKILLFCAVCIFVPFSDAALVRVKADSNALKQLHALTISVYMDAIYPSRRFRVGKLDGAVELLENFEFDPGAFYFKRSLDYAIKSGQSRLIQAFLDHGLPMSLYDSTLGDLSSTYRASGFSQERDKRRRAESSLRVLVKNIHDYAMNEYKISSFQKVYADADPEIVKPFFKLPLPQTDINEAFRFYLRQILDGFDFEGKYRDLISALMSSARPPEQAVVHAGYQKTVEKRLVDSTIAWLMARASLETLQKKRPTLLPRRMVSKGEGSENDRDTILRLSGMSAPEILSLYSENPSKQMLGYLLHVFSMYDFDSSDSDLNALAQAMNNQPGIFMALAQGIEGYESIQSVAIAHLAGLLAKYRYTEVISLVGDRTEIVKVPAPEEGFESLVCKLLETVEYPEGEDLDSALSLAYQWITGLNAPLDPEAILACSLRKPDAHRTLPLLPLGFAVSILHYAGWNPALMDRSIFLKVKERVLDDAVGIINSTRVGSASVISGLFATLAAIEQQSGPFSLDEDNLMVAGPISASSFDNFMHQTLMESFTDFLLKLYPPTIYNRFLTEIYASNNNELIAYVLSNPVHRQYIKARFDQIFADYYTDFQTEQPDIKAALMLIHCVAPDESASQLVTNVIAQCHGTLSSELAASLSCSLAEDNCDPALSNGLNEQLHIILGRKPLVLSAFAKTRKP